MQTRSHREPLRKERQNQFLRETDRSQQQLLTTYHATFWQIPVPQTFPLLLTARKTRPPVMPAAEIERSKACFTHCGNSHGANTATLADQIHNRPKWPSRV